METLFFRSEITERELLFDRRERLVKLLESTSKAEMTKMITDLLKGGEGEQKRRKLSVQVVGNPDGIKIQEGEDTCQDVDPNGVFAQVPIKPDSVKPGQVFLEDSAEFTAKLNLRPVHLLSVSNK